MNSPVQPLSVSFSGIDGAGKTTQIEYLRQSLVASGKKVSLIRFWDDVATFKRFREASSHALFKSESGVGTPDRPVNRQDKNVRTWYMTPIRLFLYLLDSLHLNLIFRRSKRSSTDVVIFDRYIYDELANLNLVGSIGQRLYTQWALRWTSQPDAAILLDADPAHARARKPEYPLDFLIRNREAYLGLSRMTPGMRVVRCQSIAAAAAEIYEIMNAA